MAVRTFSMLYDSYDDAAHVVGALEAAGVASDDISLVANQATGDRVATIADTTAAGVPATAASITTPAGTTVDPVAGSVVTDPGDAIEDETTETGAGTGATLGTILGGGAGLLAGLGMLAIPGVGPIVAAGWLIATLTGAGVGAAAGGLLGSLVGAGVDEADAQVYAEGVRRGGALVSVRADESDAARIEGILAGRTAVDPAVRRAEWETTGWSGFDDKATPITGATPAAASLMGAGDAVGPDSGLGGRQPAVATHTLGAGTDKAGTGKTVQVVEERLVVGKRDVEQGGVRVETRVVEEPVQEQVRLHEERVTLERHPVDKPVSAADTDAFKAGTIEARAHSEEAVVGKDVRVVEEIGLRKEVADRVETVRDSVRHTEVDIQDTTGSNPPRPMPSSPHLAAGVATDRREDSGRPGKGPRSD